MDSGKRKFIVSGSLPTGFHCSGMARNKIGFLLFFASSRSKLHRTYRSFSFILYLMQRNNILIICIFVLLYTNLGAILADAG
jgi:hypothetical protein